MRYECRFVRYKHGIASKKNKKLQLQEKKAELGDKKSQFTFYLCFILWQKQKNYKLKM